MKMKTKKQNDYFAMFRAQAEHSLEAARLLRDFVDAFDPMELSRQVERLHVVETDADKLKRLILESLAKDFLPPIELEDIMSLSCGLDDVTDSVEDILRHMFMYNITSVDRQTTEMIAVVYELCETLCAAAAEFREYKKSPLLPDLLKKANELEERGDQLYSAAMRELYTNCVDAKNLIIRTGIYNIIENCCDTCEHAADAMELAVLKNS